ncbi:PREDICTED: uncharacterized protein LOC105364372 [Ceratosolen solmsi marchali]|uniref:Uncharacterized protein LOC105364372 n=1 Tax=Ceratosolen solmsi marchali TaxID=326594 RepID=A0AAJ6YM41_9HYME|nr:PREDICTED: uncharacterized protein LOC105364372 [Ceratosolen solmsi marchali]
MELQIYHLFGFYGIFCMWCNFATVEALIGENVRLAGESEFPFIVAIMRYVLENNMRRNYICAGTLISRKDILTAEHCLTAQHLTGIYVLAGSSNIDQTYKYYPEWWITYDQWANSNNHVIEIADNDIGIVNLLQRVPRTIEPAHIFISPIESLYGLQVQTAGWSSIHCNILQTAEMTITTTTICELRASRIAKRQVTINNRTLCTISNPQIVLTDVSNVFSLHKVTKKGVFSF